MTLRPHIGLFALATGVVSCATVPAAPVEPAAEPAHAQERTTESTPLSDAFPVLEEYLAEKFTRAQMPGLAVGVVTREGLVWSKGFGVQSIVTHAPVTADTLFRMASVTKVFTGLAILELRDEGKLDLDAPAENYLPEMKGLKYPTTDSARITLRHLFTHTSGLPRMGRMPRFGTNKRDMTEAELVGSLDGLALQHSPGELEVYSNLGLALAGVIVGRVSGMPYHEFVKDRILDPLGMRSSTYDFLNDPDHRAVGYHLGDTRDFESGPEWVESPLPWRLGASEAMGGLSSTVNDMARFVAFELNAWPPRDGPEVGPVKRATVRESHRTAGPVRPGTLTTGVDWFLVRNPRRGVIAWHNGITDGFRAMVWLCPRAGIGLVAMTNMATTRLDPLALGAVPILVPPLRGLPPTAKKKVEEEPITDPTSGEALPNGDDAEGP